MTNPIVLQVCRERRISLADFFGPIRQHKLSQARRVAIQKLSESGCGTGTIARLVRRDISTVKYWLRPNQRERRINYKRRQRA